MATGGIPQHGLFECAVCFNDMLDQTPRALSCLHSFCETCLKQLIKNNQITCPTCRKSTEIKRNDVTELPIDFKLHQMRDLTRIKQPVQVHGQNLCQICKVNTSEFKCKECPRLMCMSCKNEHYEIEEYKQHSVFNLCNKHLGSITHLCKKCVAPLCMTCMLVTHTHHKEHFEEFSKGIAMIKRDLESIKDTIKSEVSKVDHYVEEVSHKSEISTDSEKYLLDCRNHLENKISEIDDLMKTMNKNKKTFDKIKETCVETIKEYNDLTASLDELSIEDHVEFCTKYVQLQEKAENSINAVTKLLSVKYDVTMFVLNKHVPSNMVKFSESNHIEPIKNIKLSKKIFDIPKSASCGFSFGFDTKNSIFSVGMSNKQSHLKTGEPIKEKDKTVSSTGGFTFGAPAPAFKVTPNLSLGSSINSGTSDGFTFRDNQEAQSDTTPVFGFGSSQPAAPSPAPAFSFPAQPNPNPNFTGNQPPSAQPFQFNAGTPEGSVAKSNPFSVPARTNSGPRNIKLAERKRDNHFI